MSGSEGEVRASVAAPAATAAAATGAWLALPSISHVLMFATVKTKRIAQMNLKMF